jgi:RNA polymerase sigma-32 factor
MWWIRASIQEFILRSWSLVKMGTTAAQKKLFFNLRRMKAKLDAFEDGEGQWQDWLADDEPLQDQVVADAQEADVRHNMLVSAMDNLNDREKHILTERRLTDDPKTLEELSQVYGVSRERVRQIEVRAFEKLQKAMMRLAGEKRLLAAA